MRSMMSTLKSWPSSAKRAPASSRGSTSRSKGMRFFTSSCILASILARSVSENVAPSGSWKL